MIYLPVTSLCTRVIQSSCGGVIQSSFGVPRTSFCTPRQTKRGYFWSAALRLKGGFFKSGTCLLLPSPSYANKPKYIDHRTVSKPYTLYPVPQISPAHASADHTRPHVGILERNISLQKWLRQKWYLFSPRQLRSSPNIGSVAQ